MTTGVEDGMTLRERLLVHRAVEWARRALFDVDLLEAASAARRAASSLGVLAQLGEAGCRLLDTELDRVVREVVETRAEGDRWCLDEFGLPVTHGPWDPYGERGGRVPASCPRVGRRCDEACEEEVLPECVHDSGGGG